MILLFYGKERAGEFKNFDELLDHFNRIENAKLVDHNSYQDQQKWNFIYYPYRKASNGFRSDENMEAEDSEDEQDLIEIYTGDPQDPYQIPVTPNLDLIELMRDWCFDYCYAHGLRLFEEIDGSGNMKKEKYLLSEELPYFILPGGRSSQ